MSDHVDAEHWRARLRALAAELDRLSRMDALQGQAMSMAARRRRAQLRQRVAAALKRLDEDEFGWCLQCGEPIAAARLEVDPTAPLCIRCAEHAGR